MVKKTKKIKKMKKMKKKNNIFFDNISINNINNYNNLHDFYINFSDVYSTIKIDTLDIKPLKIKNNTKKNLLKIFDFLKINNHYLNYGNIVNVNKEKINDFLKNYKNLSNQDITIFLNNFGTELLRLCYFLVSNNLIPNLDIDINNKDLYGEFTSFDIHCDLESKSSNGYNVKLNNLNLNNLEINYFNNRLQSGRLKKYFKIAILLNHFNNNNDYLNLTFFNSNKKKMLPLKKKDLLGPKEVNSGVTTFNNHKKITLWRTEEQKKVLIHELIHFYNYDFGHFNNYYSQQVVSKVNINENIEIRLNEAYTEICALIIHCFIKCYENKTQFKKTQKSINKNVSKSIVGSLNTELKFSLYQCIKILKHFGFKNYQEFLTKCNNCNKFRQTTSVFSYYFVKCALLNNLDLFIKFVKKYQIQFFNIKKTDDSKQEFVNLVNKCIHGKNFKENLSVFQNKKTSSFFLKNTLEMICLN